MFISPPKDDASSVASNFDASRGLIIILFRAPNSSSQNSITLLIVLNTLVLAMDHHPMDEEFSTYLEVFNFAFSLCFMLEMALKVGIMLAM